MKTNHGQRLLVAAMFVALWGGATACGKDDSTGGTQDTGTGTATGGTTDENDSGDTGSADTHTADTGTGSEVGTGSDSDSSTGTGTDTVTPPDTLGTDPTDTDSASETDTGTGTGTDSGTDTTPLPDMETDPVKVELRGPCDQATKTGAFEVALIYEADYEYSSVSGEVASGVVPDRVLDVIATAGQCKILKKRNLMCNPACENMFTCDTAFTCIPFPTNQDLGTVTLRGTVETVSMKPRKPGNKYFDTTVAHPAFEPGKVIQLATTSGFLGQAVLYGIGVERLLLTDSTWVVTSDEPLPIRWNAPTGDVRSRVHVEFNIDQHGTTRSYIVCDFPDNGSAEIPAELINQLVGAGISGFPNGSATRRTADSITHSGGCAELLVSSPVPAKVRVEGVTPCATSKDCPPGTTCTPPPVGICE